jgi:hypothetical protein
MTEIEEPSSLDGWGLVPKPVVEAVQALNSKILRSSEHLGKMVWPDKPRDVQDLLRMSISDAHKVARASADLRALLTAYAHRVHQPRPVMAELARAQEASPQGIPRRYSQANIEGIGELLSDEPDVELILIGFPSLSLSDLTSFSGAVGAAASKLNAQSIRPRSATRRKADEAKARLLDKPPLAITSERTAIEPVDQG